MKSRLIVGVLVAVVFVALSGLVGCTRCAEKAVETATGGKAKVALGGSVDLSGMPKELQYPGAQGIAKVSGSDSPGETLTSYLMTTSDGIDQVIAHYRQALAGWKEAMTLDTGEGKMVTFQDEPHGLTAAITVARGKDEKTSISIMYSERKPEKPQEKGGAQE